MILRRVETQDAIIVVYFMNRGDAIELHQHKWDHDSMVVQGAAWLIEKEWDDRRRLIPSEVPDVMKAGFEHGFRANMDGTILINITSKNQSGVQEALQRREKPE